MRALASWIVAMALVACAERSPRLHEAPSVPAASASPAPPSSPAPSAGLTPADERRNGSPDDITIKTDRLDQGHTGVLGRGSIHGLVIEVTDNTEKRELDGNSMMRVQLHVRANGKEGDVGLTSHAEGSRAVWAGYTFEYRGGWRDEVVLRVTKGP